jgi:XTP/dITP diphosphohydrolase
MRSLIIATENIGKFTEIKSLLGNAFDTFYSLKDFQEKIVIDEDSLLYVENAMKKARKVGDRFGVDTVADDSGLEVDALNGRPGVYSSRYGRTDGERIDRLLSEMEGVPWEKRGADFKAYIVYYLPDRERGYVFYDHLRGIIGTERRGTGGFGFDPVFFVPSLGRYLAELTIEEKSRISHRGKAMRAFKRFLNEDFFKNQSHAVRQ